MICLCKKLRHFGCLDGAIVASRRPFFFDICNLGVSAVAELQP
jgi:hypothetical protein